MKQLAALLVAAAACTRGESASIPPETTASLSSALSAGERVMDVSRDGSAIVTGHARPAPADADPIALWDPALVVDGKVQAFPIDGPIRDARFVGRTKIAIVDAQSRLVLATIGARSVTVLDAPVEAGLDASEACGCVAYMRGESPEALPAVVSLATKDVRVLDPEAAPAWMPALSPDGASVAYVSARSGLAAIWRVPTAGGAPSPVTKATDPLHLVPFPEGPDRPVWAGDLLLFRNQDGVHAVGLDDGRERWTAAALGAPHGLSGGRILFDGRAAPVQAGALRRGPP